jgi:DNA polymerase III alpha subunit
VIAKRPFKSFNDFLMKIDGRKVNKKVIHALIYSGAFDEFMPPKSTIQDRYDFMNEFYRYKKDKKSYDHMNIHNQIVYSSHNRDTL